MIHLPHKRHEIISILLVLSLLGAELLSLAHQVAAHHTLCLVHGHVIDVKDAKDAHARAFAFTDAMLALSAMDGPGVDRALNASREQGDWQILSEDVAESATDHEHCDKTVFLKVGAFRVYGPHLPPIRGEDRSPCFFAAPILAKAISPLELAPKHSPPW